MFWEELPTTSKHLSSTYSKIKGNFLLKALKFKHLKYAGENTEQGHNIIFYSCLHRCNHELCLCFVSKINFSMTKINYIYIKVFTGVGGKLA